MIICKYYDINQLQTLKEFTDKSSLSLNHLNTYSLLKNTDDLEHFRGVILPPVGFPLITQKR